MRIWPYVFGISLVALGCTEPNPAYDPDPFLPGECREGVSFEETFDDYEKPEQLDLVFVIDSSGDVEEMQGAVAEAVPGFLQSLEDAELDVRATVVTSDASRAVSIAPAVDSAEGCEDNSETIADSDNDDWRRVISCNVRQGTEAAPASEPLAVTDALFTDLDERVGLFRDSARKLVVVVTNEDDCSADSTIDGNGTTRQACADADAAGDLTDVGTLVESIASNARSDRGVAFAVISGPPSSLDDGEVRPVCSSRLGAVYGASRLEQATELFGQQGYFGNLCRADLSGAFTEIANRLALPQETTFCAGRNMLQEPLAVSGRYDGDLAPIRVGDEGFVFLGETSTCETGAIRVQPDALRDSESVEIEYCVDPDAE